MMSTGLDGLGCISDHGGLETYGLYDTFPTPDTLRRYVKEYFEVAHNYRADFARGMEAFVREPPDHGCVVLRPLERSALRWVLSVRDKIVHPSSGITGVRALAVMTLCTDFLPISDPSLGNMLCKSAAQLVISLGLQSSTSQLRGSGLPQNQQTFWIP
ncbi:hypothetical protein N7492_009691 [Penicillium capsulatum]|uniref:Uncharacterized protein n=1 Tax=Penicillium capsulatum TaxID=69766 RepID=A0A9W9HUF4_9EURO|nr:hypothetical protein N7492_009691 [Penicillium capsulatum]KAJ6107077.1 hypothetical protein N7512_010594 [Penicillium capsulatum]